MFVCVSTPVVGQESELMESLEGKEDSAFNQVCEEKSKAQVSSVKH